MLKEAIEYLKTIVAEPKSVRLDKLPDDRPDRHIIVKGDGTHEFVVTAPGDRTLRADSIDALVQVALEHFDKRAVEAGRSAIFYGFGRADLVFDTERSAERLIVEVPGSRELDFFRKAYTAEAGARLSVSDAVEAFDTTLRETVSGDAFIKSIGRLKVVAERSHEAGRDATSSLVGGIERQAVDENTPLPDGTQTFNVRPFNDGEIVGRLPLKVYLRADLNSGQWIFMPVESAWHKFLYDAAELIGTRIRKGVADQSAIPVIRSKFEQK